MYLGKIKSLFQDFIFNGFKKFKDMRSLPHAVSLGNFSQEE